MNKGNKPPQPMFCVWGGGALTLVILFGQPDSTNLSPSEGGKYKEILNDHDLEQLVHFLTREKNTLDLIITSLPGQFLNIQSADRLSDHDVVSLEL